VKDIFFSVLTIGRDICLRLSGKSVKALLFFVTTYLFEIGFYVVAAMKQNIDRC
jgi:hypothetical protein